MRGNLNPLEVAAADDRAKKVEQILADLEQSGRGVHKALGQLSTGVPQGNELHMLIIVQGRLNAAMFELSSLEIPPAAMEEPAPKIVI